MFMIMFVSRMSKNADLFEPIKRDWTGIKTTDSLFGSLFTSGKDSGKPDVRYFPFGDVVVLDANLTTAGSGVLNGNSCPDGYVPLSMQYW